MDDIKSRILKELEEIRSSSLPPAEDINFFYPQYNGTYRFRLLPSAHPDQLFFQRISRHELPSDGPTKKKIICRKYTFGEPCPICQAIATLTEKNASYQSEDLADFIASIKPRHRYYFNALFLGYREGPYSGFEFGKHGMPLKEEVVLLVLPLTAAEQVLTYATEFDPKYLLDPEVGRSIMVVRVSKGDRPEYRVIVESEPYRIDIASLHSKLYDLERVKLSRDRDYEEIAEDFRSAVISSGGGMIAAALAGSTAPSLSAPTYAEPPRAPEPPVYYPPQPQPQPTYIPPQPQTPPPPPPQPEPAPEQEEQIPPEVLEYLKRIRRK